LEVAVAWMLTAKKAINDELTVTARRKQTNKPWDDLVSQHVLQAERQACLDYIAALKKDSKQLGSVLELVHERGSPEVKRQNLLMGSDYLECVPIHQRVLSHALCYHVHLSRIGVPMCQHWCAGVLRESGLW
jgi:hypothetical protein